MIISYRFLIGFFCFFVYNADHRQNKIGGLAESFETKKFIESWAGAEKCCDYSLQRSDSVAKRGRYSLRIELRSEDNVVANGKRAELRLSPERKLNVERWYKVSYFLPNEYISDPTYDILAQWHERPDWRLGENWRSPALSLLTQNNNWKFRIMWAIDKVNTNETISGQRIFNMGRFVANKWTEWIFHMYFSYKDDGLVQIWKNGTLVLDYHGPNYYNDERGPYFKVGVYKSNWMKMLEKSTVRKRVLFIDDIKIGGKAYTFAKISAE